MEFIDVMEVSFINRADAYNDDRATLMCVSGEWKGLTIESIKVILREQIMPLIQLQCGDITVTLPDVIIGHFTQI